MSIVVPLFPSDRVMSAEFFADQNPNWRQDVTTAIGLVLLDLIRGAMPPPWNDETVEVIARSTSTAAIISFEKIRPLIGDDIFGELVLFAGEEAKRLAMVVAGRPLGTVSSGAAQ
jgi:hypothetical protein